MLVPSPPPTTQLGLRDVDAATSLATLDDQAARYARASKAMNTIRSYRVDLADFQAWCDAHALPCKAGVPDALGADHQPIAVDAVGHHAAGEG